MSVTNPWTRARASGRRAALALSAATALAALGACAGGDTHREGVLSRRRPFEDASGRAGAPRPGGAPLRWLRLEHPPRPPGAEIAGHDPLVRARQAGTEGAAEHAGVGAAGADADAADPVAAKAAGAEAAAAEPVGAEPAGARRTAPEPAGGGAETQRPTARGDGADGADAGRGVTDGEVGAPVAAGGHRGSGMAAAVGAVGATAGSGTAEAPGSGTAGAAATRRRGAALDAPTRGIRPLARATRMRDGRLAVNAREGPTSPQEERPGAATMWRGANAPAPGGEGKLRRLAGDAR